MDIKGTIKAWIAKQFIRLVMVEQGFMLEFSKGVAWTAIGAILMLIFLIIVF